MLNEPGARKVADVLPGAFLGMVNLAEVISKLCERGMPSTVARQAIGDLGIEVVQFTDEDACLAGALRPITKSAGLSLGDRACLALGRKSGGTVLTTDKAWATLESIADITVSLIR